MLSLVVVGSQRYVGQFVGHYIRTSVVPGRFGSAASFRWPSEKTQLPALRLAADDLPNVACDGSGTRLAGQHEFVHFDDCRNQLANND